MTRPTPVSTRFPFTATGVEPQKFTLANGETRSFADVSADQPYTFTESVPTGWFLTVSGDPACVQSGNTLTVSPTPGQVVNCLLTNSNLDLTSISVNKVTVPAGAAQLFDFTASGPLGDSLHFQLADGGTRSLTGITTLLPYTITEAPVPGWRLSTSGSPNCVPITNGVRITPIPFVAVNCTFTNTKLASISIDKNTVPSGDPTPFGFTTRGLSPAAFELTDASAPQTFTDVAPDRSYTIAETPVAGWSLTSREAVAPSTPSPTRSR